MGPVSAADDPAKDFDTMRAHRLLSRGWTLIRPVSLTSTRPFLPTPSFGHGVTTHWVSSGGFSNGRPFSSGNGAFPATNTNSVSSGSSFPLLNNGTSFSSSSSSRPASGNILLPSSLTLRPSTNDWDYDGSWTTQASPQANSSFSSHPPEQRASFSYVGGGGGSRTLGGLGRLYGAHTDHNEYEYGGGPRPQSRCLSVMELRNDNDERPTSVGVSSALHRTGSAEGERPAMTNGFTPRASALVLDDHDQQWEHELRQPAGEQQHFAAEREYQSAVNGRGWRRAGSVRGLDAAAPGGAQAGARLAAGRDGCGGDGGSR
ncbi:hypothetical protein K438DRAFT_1870407 [Mycena galopus ATCC 62051]|nr:hypothetical protein K438DRAFT_1870407 [Mycena galopus ATCC 62051]